MLPPSRSRRATLLSGISVASIAVGATSAPQRAAAKRPEGVNRPELLPNTPGESTPLIDVARILSERQRRGIEKQIAEVERASGVRIRVLTQTYPNSPGLAIRQYWNVDTCLGRSSKTDDGTCKGDQQVLVYVHDTGGLGSAVVNFSVARGVESRKPFTFWRQLQNKYGNEFYIREHGDSDTVVDVVDALHDAFMPVPAER